MNFKTKIGSAGFTLVEILVAICILALVVTPFLNVFIQTATTNHMAMKSEKISTMIQYEIEKLKRGLYNECFVNNELGRQPLEKYFVTYSTVPYQSDSAIYTIFDFVLKEAADQTLQAYAIAPDGTSCLVSCSPHMNTIPIFIFSQQDSHFILKLQTMEGAIVINDQQAVYNDHSGSNKPIVINLYISAKPETLPFLINLEGCSNLSNVTIKLWDNAFYQNEGRVSYKDSSGQQQEVVLASDLSEGGGVPPFTTMMDQSDACHSSMVQLTVRMYDTLDAEQPVSERISIVPISH